MEIHEVENLAELARIELSMDEKKELLADMDSILGYVKQIEDMKTESGNVSPTERNVWREDRPEERNFSKEGIVSQFPDSLDGFLKVKKIL